MDDGEAAVGHRSYGRRAVRTHILDQALPGRREDAALILAGLHLPRRCFDGWRLRASYIEGGRISYERLSDKQARKMRSDCHIHTVDTPCVLTCLFAATLQMQQRRAQKASLAAKRFSERFCIEKFRRGQLICYG